MFGFLTGLISKLPVLGPLLAKLWTDNSKIAEIKAEESLEETKAFARGRISPKFLLRYVVVVVFGLFALLFIVHVFWPNVAPDMSLDSFERLMKVAGNILGAMF